MKLFNRLCLYFSILLLIYILYRSEITYNGQLRVYYFLYLYILLFLIFFFSFTFYLNKKIQKYLIVVISSSVFALYCFESYQFYNLYNYKGADFDKRSRHEFYNKLKKNDQNIVVSVVPSNQIFSKISDIFFLAGISNSRTIHCNEIGYYSIYQSDRYGFNNPDEEWENEFSEIEYFLVGDSFTHGACVNRQDDIASQLRLLSKQKVLNLGYSGNGPLIEYATIREYLKPKVKKILWIYTEGNDLQDLSNELKSDLLNNYITNPNYSQNLKMKQTLIDKSLQSKIFELNKISYLHEKPIIKLIKLFETRNLLMNLSIKKVEYKKYEEFKNILRLANILSIKNNSKLYFVYLPDFDRYKKGENFQKIEIKKILASLNIPFIDIDIEVFKKEKNPLKLFSQRNGHYNVEGYKKIALKIYDKTR